MRERHADILVVGGGTGGCAAAVAAASLGRRVIMTEQTDWIGGQLSSQAVPPDEHAWIEQFGCTRRYREYRERVRQHYRDSYPLRPEARANERLNPGGGSVSRLCHEPRATVAALNGMMAWPQSAGRLTVLLDRRPVAVDMDGDRARAVTLENLRDSGSETISADYVIDATELGDLLPLAGVEYVSGAESQDQTGEPHARPGPAEPDSVQAITWCFPMAYDPDGSRVIDRPVEYSRWRDYVPALSPPWSGKLLSWETTHPITLEPRTQPLFAQKEGGPCWWRYRQIITRAHYEPGAMPYEATLVNWPQNDYFEQNIIDRPDDEVARALAESRQLSLSLLYWMQTEAPRPDGGVGYPGLFLRPDITGTDDGLAKYPYIRESRRIVAEFTVTENHVGADARGERPAERFEDSVGIGCYRIDLHPDTGKRNYIDVSSMPFEIPLGALVPVRVENLLPACKNIGTTHITNGCYRLHPVEWNIGEAAGLLAAYCLERRARPRQVRNDSAHLADFQALLDAQGVERRWPETHAV